MSSIGERYSESVRGLSRIVVVICFAGTLLVAAGGCITSRPAADDTVTVEGVVTVRGNEPFTAYMLETAEGNLYILELQESFPADLVTPTRLSVSGRMAEGEWSGAPSSYAHIEVDEWTHLD